MEEPKVLLARITADLARLADQVTAAPIPARPPTETSVSKLMLTVVEAAQALRVSRSGIFELLRSGEVGSVKIGRRRLIPVATWHAYVERITERRGVC